MILEVDIEDAENGRYSAQVTNIDDCMVTDGDTWDEINENVKEMVHGYLELLVKLGDIPTIPDYELHITYKTRWDSKSLALS